ncbi:hypothetical protein PV729_04295 [Streptomyces europaeiscabiei]|uniref:Uncharacterized protein n=1 Tax=Streptomyces europaeiscabiei TaxID=146819 RepID=A0ABU4N8R0_9ACTN|nr:hypothetical protein [Streptomyces europaeiscabiei]MDX3550998.1 hypothetical protein [Streptomyces europaeiscabiei]MDX3698442.1 hypothetical protein [Streptomyces europaeiscabiei]
MARMRVYLRNGRTLTIKADKHEISKDHSGNLTRIASTNPDVWFAHLNLSDVSAIVDLDKSKRRWFRR